MNFSLCPLFFCDNVCCVAFFCCCFHTVTAYNKAIYLPPGVNQYTIDEKVIKSSNKITIDLNIIYFKPPTGITQSKSNKNVQTGTKVFPAKNTHTHTTHGIAIHNALHARHITHTHPKNRWVYELKIKLLTNFNLLRMTGQFNHFLLSGTGDTVRHNTAPPPSAAWIKFDLLLLYTA